MVFVMFFMVFFGKNIYGFEYRSATQTTDPTPQAVSKMAHLTLIFNTFVMMLLVNIINSRVITELNPFVGLKHNYLTAVLLTLTLVM